MGSARRRGADRHAAREPGRRLPSGLLYRELDAAVACVNLHGLALSRHWCSQGPCHAEENRALLHAQSERLLPVVLRNAGYATGAVSTNLWISDKTGFAPGFDKFVSISSGRQKRVSEKTLRARLGWALEAARAEVDDGAMRAERVLEEWVEQLTPEKPFFWFVNLIECHSPYLPPRPYNDLSIVNRARAGDEARRHLTLRAIWRSCVAEFDVPDPALERMRHLYARSVRYMDDWLGRLLERLDRRGVLDDTLVIITSDHGENFGEGGLLAHSFSLDDRLIHVPLVVQGPGADADPPEVTTLGRLPRIIAEMVELDSHPWLDDDLPPGPAVAQLDPPIRADDPVGEDIAERWQLSEEGYARLTTPFICATDGKLKLLRRAGQDLLVDLSADPLEVDPQPLDAAPDRSAAVGKLLAALDNPAVSASAALAESGLDDVPTESERERRELEERMRVLGYL